MWLEDKRYDCPESSGDEACHDTMMYAMIAIVLCMRIVLAWLAGKVFWLAALCGKARQSKANTIIISRR
jgi:hypothetical protein